MKRLVFFFLVLCLVVTLCGCGSIFHPRRSARRFLNRQWFGQRCKTPHGRW